MRRRVTQCLVARNGNDVSWEFPGPTNLSLSRKRTYVWNLCGTDGQCVGEMIFCVLEPQYAGQDPSFDYNI